MEHESGLRSDETRRITGKWHLMGLDADEGSIPNHRVDLVFRIEDERMQGAIISRVSNEDVPLANVQFDGTVLRIQMTARPEGDEGSVPILVLRSTQDRFEGAWSEATVNGSMRLKLIRAKE